MEGHLKLRQISYGNKNSSLDVIIFSNSEEKSWNNMLWVHQHAAKQFWSIWKTITFVFFVVVVIFVIHCFLISTFLNAFFYTNRLTLYVYYHILTKDYITITLKGCKEKGIRKFKFVAEN